jgi:hypothetical protein
VHGAAEVRFDLPWEVMERQNVLGAENILALARRFAERGKLHRLDYVSTTYIAGDRRGLCREDEIDLGQGHRNEYERSKRVAELAVDRERKKGLPVAVHRPSIIVGDSRTGKASSFKGAVLAAEALCTRPVEDGLRARRVRHGRGAGGLRGRRHDAPDVRAQGARAYGAPGGGPRAAVEHR